MTYRVRLYRMSVRIRLFFRVGQKVRSERRFDWQSMFDGRAETAGKPSQHPHHSSSLLRRVACLITPAVVACRFLIFASPIGSGSEVDLLWWVCLSVCLSVCLRGYLRNHTRDIYQIFVQVTYVRGSVLLRHVDDRPHRLSEEEGDGSAQRGRSVIYDCLVPYAIIPHFHSQLNRKKSDYVPNIAVVISLNRQNVNVTPFTRYNRLSNTGWTTGWTTGCIV